MVDMRRVADAETVMDVVAFDEVVPRKISRVRSAGQKMPLSTISVVGLDNADTALSLVSEAGQAVRKLEKDSREAITRATNAALAVKEKLDQTIVRADAAEAALRNAKSEITELSDLLEDAGDEITKLRSQVASLEQQLSDATGRAKAAEQRVEDANESIQRIVTAIRTELPIAPAATGSA
jgi:chromosome segregation ATPase